MGGSWFTENFNDFSDEFFDVLGDVKYCESVLEDIDPCDGEEDWEAKFQAIETPPLNMLSTITSSSFHNSQNDSTITQISDESRHIKKWPSSFPDVSETKYVRTSRTFSPVSVLDNSSTSASAEKLISDFPKTVVPVRRPRSKKSQSRRRVFSSIFFPARLARVDRDESDCVRVDTKMRLPRSSDAEVGEIRRCTHCQVSKTPQWREGPMGPKTLCNACGVRYRSGRLYPEYRPAASPTFVPSQHSNSHRKVLEMRKKVASPAAVAPVTGFTDNFFS